MRWRGQSLRRPLRGPELFFTSTKTGVGVSEAFAYVARQVLIRWEREEAQASGRPKRQHCSSIILDIMLFLLKPG